MLREEYKLQKSENKVLRKIFILKKGNLGHCIIRNLMTYMSHLVFLGYWNLGGFNGLGM
jgi:hypothetical protein